MNSQEARINRKDSINRYLVARKAITDKEGKNGDISGQIDCPVCKKGKLRYSIAGYNGHIHAACSTEDCVKWME